MSSSQASDNEHTTEANKVRSFPQPALESPILNSIKLSSAALETFKAPSTGPTMPLTPRKSYPDLASTSNVPSLPQSHLPPTPEATPQLLARTLKRAPAADIENSPSASRSNKRPRPNSASDCESTANPTTSENTITPSSPAYLFPPTCTPNDSTRSTSTPAKSIKFKPSPFRKPNIFQPKQPPSISGIELRRAAESILMQVDWREVAEYVAANRKGGVYKMAVKGFLQEKIDALHEGQRSGGEDGEQGKG